jgi:hypothetical protein
LNLRPSGYEPDELPGCSTPRHVIEAETRFGAAFFSSDEGYIGEVRGDLKAKCVRFVIFVPRLDERLTSDF